MKYILLVAFCVLSFSASAQWYRVDLKIFKHERLPQIAQIKDHSMARIPHAALNTKIKIRKIQLDRSEYSDDAAIYFAIQKAQHSMRFHMNSDASYNFSELAHLYIQQNKLTEAKWYLLQSNYISRQQNDHKHTISNLIDLAMIKAELGDFVLARQDLSEAQYLASTKGFSNDLPEIDRKMSFLKQNKPWPVTVEQGYSPATLNITKIE